MGGGGGMCRSMPRSAIGGSISNSNVGCEPLARTPLIPSAPFAWPRFAAAGAGLPTAAFGAGAAFAGGAAFAADADFRAGVVPRAGADLPQGRAGAFGRGFG